MERAGRTRPSPFARAVSVQSTLAAPTIPWPARALNPLDLTGEMLLNGLVASAAMEGVPQRVRDERERYRSGFGPVMPWYRRRFMGGRTALRFFR